jgi:MFS family permease
MKKIKAQTRNMEATEQIIRSYRNPKKIVLLIASMLTIMSGATISPALPGISEAFRDTPNVSTLISFVLTAPALAIALSASFIGIAVDRFGRKPVLIVATILYGIAGASGLFLNSLVALIAGRFVLGFSVAALMTATNTLVVDYYEGVERQAFMGAQSSAVGFSGVLFLIGGGFLADLSWRAPFAIYLTAYLLLPAIVIVLHEPEHMAKSKAGPKPKLPGRIKLRIAAAFLLGFVLMATFYIIPVKLPFYLQALGETSAARAGIAIACGTLAMAITALFYRRLRRLFSVRNLFAIAFLILSSSFFILAHASVYWMVLAATAVNGAGSGVMMPNLNIWLAGLAPEHARGRIFGGLTTAFFLGQFLSPILIAPVVERNGLGGLFGGYGVSGICQLTFGLGFVVLSLQSLRRKN